MEMVLISLADDPLTNNKLLELRYLEKNHAKWLKTEEQEWRTKSRALWIKEGDNNTIFFHQFVNSIWEIKDEQGKVAASFGEKEKLEKSFSTIFFLPPEDALSKKYWK
jgi:hypothetical protein